MTKSILTSVANEVPLLLLIFNRPKALQQVMQALRTIKPRYLYIAADGPRLGKPGEKETTDAARQVALSVDWACEVKTLFRDENLGCRLAVSGAIDWFFDNVDSGVILEDDCVPDPSFFLFAAELLEHYRDDERIMAITAKHHGAAGLQRSKSYFFSRYNHCWGWASWRRAWQFYDHDMVQWPDLRDTEWLLDVGSGSRTFRRHWTKIFDSVYSGKIDSWAYRWTFSCWAQSALSVLPTRNLVSNIGFDSDATHTTTAKNREGIAGLEEMEFPLEHPSTMIRAARADVWSDRNVFGIGKGWVKEYLRAVPGVGPMARFIRSR